MHRLNTDPEPWEEGPLPPPSLRLLVPPLRLMSAIMWRVVQQRDVRQYGMLADFVSLVTEAVPELFCSTRGVELILGLRARLILELCHRDDPVDVRAIQPHLSGIQLSLPLIKYGDSAEVEETGVYFVELVQTLIKDIQERENFFQNVFPLEFGSSYDSALQTLMWDFLYRLEQFLPVPDLLQTVAWLSTDCSALKDCEESIRNPDCLKTLLHHHKCFGHGATSASSPSLNSGDSILSALSGKRERACQLSAADPQNAAADMPVCVMDGTDVETVVVMSDWSEIEIDSNQVVEEAVDDNGAQSADCEQRQSQNNDEGELRMERGSNEEYYLEESALKCKDGDETEQRVDEKRCDGVTEAEQSNPSSNVASALTVSVRAEQEAAFTTRRSTRKPKKTWKIRLVNLQKQKRKPVVSKLASSQKRERKPVVPERNPETDTRTSGDPGTSINRDVTELPESPHGFSSNGTAGVSQTFSCPHCLFAHNQERYLKSHIKKIHPLPEASKKEPHVCQVCGKGYRYPGMLKAHERSHTGEQPFQCTASRCGRRFSYVQALRRHRLVHARAHAQKKAVHKPPGDVVQEPEPDREEPRVYGCLYCSESFSSLSARRDHYKTHPEEELKRCSDCGKRLSCQAALVRHKRGHEGERPHECPLCGSSFACTTSFKRHTLTHQPERPYRCGCGKGFTYKGALLSHQRSHTAERSYRCSQCDKTFLYPGELRKHERTHSDEKPYLCPHCGKSFKRERILRAHVAGHTEEKIFKCSSCSKTFAYKASLTRHELTHSGVRPFLCSDCGKTFFSFGELQKHQRYHTGQKPFQCLHCDKSFTQACYLQLHTRYHTGVRPYSCPQCFKSFFTSCRLKRHMQIHTDHKPYECAECGKRFRQAYVLKVHRRTHLERELRL